MEPSPAPKNDRLEKTSTLAILGLIFAILAIVACAGMTCASWNLCPFIGVSVVLVNLAALLRITLSHKKFAGTGIAIAGLILGLLTIAIGNSTGKLIYRANKTKARYTCVTIDAAVLAFRDEYGHLPLPRNTQSTGKDVEIITDTPKGIEFLAALMGMEDDSPDMINPKKIRFLDIPEGKRTKTGGRSGILHGPDNRILGLYDPWGHPYHIILDADDNQSLPNPFSDNGTPALNRRTATFSLGKNSKNDGGAKDDVKSW